MSIVCMVNGPLGRLLLVCLSLCWLLPSAWAHRASDSFVQLDLSGERITARWDIALRDLHQLVGLDQDGDLAITWGELKAARESLAAHTLARLRLETPSGDCPLGLDRLRVVDHGGRAYAALSLDSDCPPISGMVLHYDLLFEQNPEHRGLLVVHHATGVSNRVLSPDAPSATLTPASIEETAVHFWKEGVWHIWIGFDHILFLLALLLPTVLWWEDGAWRRADDFRGVLLRVTGIVTAFTVAHSLTLAVATLDWWVPPGRWVETVIAATVVLAALNNLYPLIRGRIWLVAFGLGLIHGFGFAGVLGELGLPTGSLVLALLSFNLGVECGQLVIVLAVLPLLYLLRDTVLYRQGLFRGGSLLTAAIATVWLVERGLDVHLVGL